MIGHSENVNEISNSLNMDISSLVSLRKNFSEVDILCIEEIKIDRSYPDTNFLHFVKIETSMGEGREFM